MTQTNDNIIDRDQLQEAYIESIIDGMDHKTMYQFVMIVWMVILMIIL